MDKNITQSIAQCLRQILVGGVSLVGVAMPGWAQQEEAALDGRTAIIEEVLVTARRVEESLQETPVSIAAFTQRDLQQIGISEIGEIARYTPNLEIRTITTSQDNYALAIRGMSASEVVMTVDPAIGIYLDGVYIARSAGMAFDIVDTERIEVLRGPQGTLFGRNTIGGALNIISAKPRGEFAFKQQATYGARNYQRFLTTLDTPRLGNVAARLSFLTLEHGGLVGSLHTGGQAGKREATGLRLALQWAPTEALNVDYSFDLSRRDSNPNTIQISHMRPVYADPDGEFYGGAYYEALAEHASPRRLGQLPVTRTGLIGRSDTDSHTLTVEWQALPTLTVKSISAYRKQDSLTSHAEGSSVAAPADGSLCRSPNPGDYDFVTGTCVNPVPAGELVPNFEFVKQDREHEQWTQELQFIGSAFDERLRFTTGLYLFQEEGNDFSPLRLVITAPVAAAGFADAFGLPPETLIPQNRGNSLLIDVPHFAHWVDNRSYAAYGSFTFIVLPRLDVTLGLRYSVDDKDTTLRNTLDGELKTLTDDNRWTNFNPSLTVSYQWTEALNTYAKVVTGYRSGGHDVRVSTSEAFFDPFDEENVVSYELGWKSDLFDRKLRFNGALYYADYADQQISSLEAGAEGAGSKTLNAGEAVHSGVELDAIWAPIAGLRLTGSYAWLDVDFKEFLAQRKDLATGAPSDPGTVEDISDIASSPYAPEHSASLAAQYQFAPRRWGQLTLRVGATHTGDMDFSPQLNEFIRSEAHTLVDARATLSAIPAGRDGSLRVSLWGKNLTNKAVREFGTDVTVLGYAINTYAELRSVGIDLVYTFNR